MSYESKIIEFQRLAKELSRKKPKIVGKKYKNETVYLDFIYHEKCDFDNCELILNYGILSLINCKFSRCKFTSEKDGLASGILQVDRMIRESGSLEKWR